MLNILLLKSLIFFGGVGFSYLVWRNRVLAIALIIALLPSYLIRFKIFGIPATWLEVMILLLFLIFVLQNLGNLITLAKKNSWILNFFLVIFLISGVFGLIVTPDLRAGAGIFKAYIIEPLLFFFVFINAVKSTADVKKIILALGIASVCVALIAGLQYFTGWWIPEPWQDWPIRRVTSVYSYPNAVGLFVAPILIFLLGLLGGGSNNVFGQTKKMKILMVAMAILLLASLFAARVEGAYLAVTAAIGLRLLFTRWRWWVVGCGVVTLIILLAWAPTRDLLLFRDVSGDVRLALWQGTINLLRHQPLFGAGLAGFPLEYDLYRLPSHVELLLYSHNIFLDFWVELGLLGLAWFVVIVVWFFKTLWPIARQRIDVFKQQMAYSLIMVMVGVLVYGLVDVPYFKNDLAVLFWLWLGLAKVLGTVEKTT